MKKIILVLLLLVLASPAHSDVGFTYSASSVTTSGNFKVTNQIYMQSDTGDFSTRLGYEAGAAVPVPAKSTFVGYGAGQNMSSGGGYSTFIGVQAGSGFTGSGDDYNTYAGYYAGFYSIGSNNTIMGANAGRTWGSYNTAVGVESAYTASGASYQGNYTTAVGHSAIWGGAAGYGDYNTALGYMAGYGIAESLGYNLFLGAMTGTTLRKGGYNILIGYDVEPYTADISKYMNIGDTIYGYLDTDRIGIGISSPTVSLDVLGTVRVSTAALSGDSLCFAGAVDVLPTTGYARGCLIYLNSDPTNIYLSTETVTKTESWLAK